MSYLINELIGEFISQQNNHNLFTEVSLGQNLVNTPQLSGLQAFATVNRLVNKSVYSCLQAFIEKRVLFVNKQVLLENLIISVKKELLAPQHSQNVKNVIGYAVHNLGLMNRALCADIFY